MTLKKSVIHQLCVIIFFVINAHNEVLNIPSQPQIPSLYEAVASSYNLSTVDLNTRLPVYTPWENDDIQFNWSASQSCFGKGAFSVYGKDYIQTEKKRFDFGSHKLFFHNTFGKIVLGAGAGYDYDGKNEIKIDETIIMNGSAVSDEYRYLYINDWEENTFFGNVNGALIRNDAERILFGFEMSHCIKDGIEYSETAEYSTDMYMGFQDNITYFNYDEGAYRNTLSAGVGLLREYVSKRGYERLRLTSLRYNQNIERSDLSSIEGVRSYFFSSVPDNIQFSGKNYKNKSIAVDVLFSEMFPDKVYLENTNKKTAQMYLKYLKFTLQYEENRKSILSINQWNMSDIYYGVNEKKSRHYPLSIMADNATDCILFQKFRVRLDSHLEGMIERYPEGMVEGKCFLEFKSALGCTLPIRDVALLDINYFLFPVTTSFRGNNHSFDFGYDVNFDHLLQLRIAILK